MKRREFITLLSGGMASPLSMRAQQAELPVVEFVHPDPIPRPWSVYSPNSVWSYEFPWALARSGDLLALDLRPSRVNLTPPHRLRRSFRSGRFGLRTTPASPTYRVAGCRIWSAGVVARSVKPDIP